MALDAKPGTALAQHKMWRIVPDVALVGVVPVQMVQCVFDSDDDEVTVTIKFKKDKHYELSQ